MRSGRLDAEGEAEQVEGPAAEGGRRGVRDIAAVRAKCAKAGHRVRDDPGRVAGGAADQALYPAQRPDCSPGYPLADRWPPDGDHGRGNGEDCQEDPGGAGRDAGDFG